VERAGTRMCCDGWMKSVHHKPRGHTQCNAVCRSKVLKARHTWCTEVVAAAGARLPVTHRRRPLAEPGGHLGDV